MGRLNAKCFIARKHKDIGPGWNYNSDTELHWAEFPHNTPTKEPQAAFREESYRECAVCLLSNFLPYLSL